MMASLQQQQHHVVCVLLALMLMRVDGQGQVPRGSYTKELFTSTIVDEAPDDCDEMMACAGVTYRFEDSLESRKKKRRQLAAAAGQNLTNAEHEEFPFDVTKDDPLPEESAVFFHGFIPPLQQEEDDNNKSNKNETWVTYRSKKPFVFHPGKIIPTSPSSSTTSTCDSSTSGSCENKNSYTLHDLTLEQAKSECQSNPQCIGFSYPVHSSDLLRMTKVTFATSVWTIENDNQETWRTYMSNDEHRASLVNQPFQLKIEEEDLMEPYHSCCQKANTQDEQQGISRTVPSIQDVQAMDHLERVSCNMSRQEFYDRYESQRLPVILVGCDEGWLAHERWTHENLIPRFDNTSKWRSSLQEEKREKDDMEWQYIVNAMQAKEHFYIFDQLKYDHQQTLNDDYVIPPMFQNVDLYKNMSFPRDYGPMKWWCLGSRHSGTFPHSDPHATDAWNTVIYGHKWWILYPEGVEEEEVECSEACSIDDATELDWYTSVGVNAGRMEYGLNAVKPLHILQKPGETIYVPYGIVHSVLNMDETAAITSNYAAPGNLEGVWESMVKEAEEENDDVHWMKMYYGGVLNQEQRRRVRETAYWPPWEREYPDDDEDEDEDEEYDNEALYEGDEDYEEMQDLEEDYFSFHGDEEEEEDNE